MKMINRLNLEIMLALFYNRTANNSIFKHISLYGSAECEVFWRMTLTTYWRSVITFTFLMHINFSNSWMYTYNIFFMNISITDKDLVCTFSRLLRREPNYIQTETDRLLWHLEDISIQGGRVLYRITTLTWIYGDMDMNY